MISERCFRLNKNGEPDSRCYCRHPELIENYAQAIADTTQTWDCHHRFEALFTKQELIKYNWYYDVEPNCLVFLTRKEHNAIHNKEKFIGKKQSEEAIRKMSKAHSKKVICVETCEVFESTRDAERRTGISQCCISAACRGKLKTSGGFHWKFA